jgi:hypothetical protein
VRGHRQHYDRGAIALLTMAAVANALVWAAIVLALYLAISRL